MRSAREAPEWVTASRVVIVAGKGGVGSSTTAAALAIVAADAGLDVLLIAVDGKPGLGPLLGGQPLGPREQVLHAAGTTDGRIRGRSVPADLAFGDYLALKGVGGLLRRAASAASLDVIAASTPGLEHLLVLGKIKELDRERAADLIIVDAPPAGHAAPFLRSASALQRMVATGPVRDQADEVADMLADASRCQCLLVTLAEETPVNEVIELAYDMEEELGLALAPLVVNACWPDRAGLAITAAVAAKLQRTVLPAADRRALDAAAHFGQARLASQREQLARLDAQLPLPRVQLPRLATARLQPAHLDALADALAVEPVRPLLSAAVSGDRR
jgi:anion-transporting  ArsA/GET3 family ATPase